MTKIFGQANAPEVLEDKMIEKYYRFDSGNRIFKELTGNKNFSLTTDAVVLTKAYNKKIPSTVIY